jgi:hypothetical protein
MPPAVGVRFAIAAIKSAGLFNPTNAFEGHRCIPQLQIIVKTARRRGNHEYGSKQSGETKMASPACKSKEPVHGTSGRLGAQAYMLIQEGVA